MGGLHGLLTALQRLCGGTAHLIPKLEEKTRIRSVPQVSYLLERETSEPVDVIPFVGRYVFFADLRQILKYRGELGELVRPPSQYISER